MTDTSHLLHETITVAVDPVRGLEAVVTGHVGFMMVAFMLVPYGFAFLFLVSKGHEATRRRRPSEPAGSAGRPERKRSGGVT
jgi:hypothetical protein